MLKFRKKSREDSKKKIGKRMLFKDKKKFLELYNAMNHDLMDKCRTLREYMIYTDTVRKYSKRLSFPEAVDRAISECIRDGVLKDFLEKNKVEVRSVSIFEYDEEKHRKHEREIGENRLGQLVSILIKEGKIEEAALVAEDAEKRKEYYEKYRIKG